MALVNQNEELYIPSPDDVYEVRHILIVRRFPPEIATIILDEARYWPKVTWRVAATELSTFHWTVIQEIGPQCHLLTPRLSDWINLEEGSFITREVRFIITSHDQGWTTDDVQGYTTRYMGSHTWFEASIVRHFREDIKKHNHHSDDIETRIKESISSRGPIIIVDYDEKPWTELLEAEPPGEVITVKSHADSDRDVWHIQRNIRASWFDATHEVVWADTCRYEHMDEKNSIDTTGAGSGIGFVQSLQSNDRIAVISRALKIGWVNHVRDMKVELFYSV